jgi:hypothetical protein
MKAITNKRRIAPTRISSVAALIVAIVGAVGLLTAGAIPASAATSGPKVWRVGTYHGRTGTHASIQAAINASHPGDWVLKARGTSTRRSKRCPGNSAAGCRNAQ